MESVFAVVDIFFVSHLGKHATSTVGLTESVITIVYSLAMGISMAASAMVARRIGEKNKAEASRAAAQCMILSIVITLIISIAGVVFAADILRMMGAEDAAIAEGTTYTRIIMGGSIVIMLLFLINGIFRGAGNPMIAMKSLAMRIINTGYIFYGIGMVISNAFNGAGDTRTPTWVNLFGFWFFQIPIAWLMANQLSWGPTGVFIAIPVAETAITIVSLLIFRKGKWKLVKI